MSRKNTTAHDGLQDFITEVFTSLVRKDQRATSSSSHPHLAGRTCKEELATRATTLITPDAWVVE